MLNDAFVGRDKSPYLVGLNCLKYEQSVKDVHLALFFQISEPHNACHIGSSMQ
jgi:hypothetical protein